MAEISLFAMPFVAELVKRSPLHGSGVYFNLFTLMLGAKVTAGFILPGDAEEKLDAALPISATQNEVRRVLSLVRFLGIEPQGETTEFPLWVEDFKNMKCYYHS